MDLFKPNVNKMQKKKNVRGLIKALSYKDEQVRHKAAYALGSLGDARAASALLAALPDKSTFGSVAYALAKLKEPRLFDLLLPALNDDTLCSEAADALGILGDLRAVEPLIGLLKRQDTETRQSAVVALSNLHDPHSAGALREALNDADGHVRATAIDGLCELPDRLDKETLVRLLHDPDIVVRGKAAWNLDVKQIGIPEDPMEQAWYAAGRQNWDMAVKLGLIATEPLLLATQTEDMEERVGAAIALAKLGDRRAVEPLISTLTSPYYSTEVCKKVHIQAFEALGKYGDLRAVKPLQQYAQSSVTEPSERSVAWRALSALESRLPGFTPIRLCAPPAARASQL